MTPDDLRADIQTDTQALKAVGRLFDPVELVEDIRLMIFPDADAITVTETNGKVRLTGKVDSWHAYQVAGETAWGAPGTTQVENLLTVV